MQKIINNLILIAMLFILSGCQAIKFFDQTSQKGETKKVDLEMLNGVDKIVYGIYSPSMAPQYRDNRVITITKEHIDYFRGNTKKYEKTKKQIDTDKFNKIIQSILNNNISKCPMNEKYDPADMEPMTGCGSDGLKIFKSDKVIFNEYDECGRGNLCGNYAGVYNTIQSVMDQSKTIKFEKTEEKDEPEEPIELIQIPNLKIPTIYFEVDKYIINTQQKKKLKNSISPLLDHSIEFEYIVLKGHTDQLGSDEYNYHIGLKRAEEIKKLLIEYGIDKMKITTRSYGKSAPICTEDTIECQNQNRRVDIEVIY